MNFWNSVLDGFPCAVVAILSAAAIVLITCCSARIVFRSYFREKQRYLEATLKNSLTAGELNNDSI